MTGLTTELIKAIAADDEKVFVTEHVAQRMRQRNIRYDDIISALMSGEVIESYPDDYPYPSALVLGYATDNAYLHVVCGSDGEYLWIITAYYPSEQQWEADMKTRKE